MIYSIAIAGSTQKTLLCTQVLSQDPRFRLQLIIAPQAKTAGRKQLLEPNPMETFGRQKNIPTILIDKTINKIDFEQFISKKFEFLLVVDFGYLIPAWLLNWPKVAAVNVHPSALPRWRGSAPAQFVLLNGEAESAVSLIQMDNQLDHGPIISQYPFVVAKHWTQTEYYQTSFSLITKHLTEDLISLATKQLTPQPQPDLSPTPVAQKLTKKDSFVPWEKILEATNHFDTLREPQGDMLRPAQHDKAQGNSDIIHNQPDNVMLRLSKHDLAKQLEQATKAYLPWPVLWTLIPTLKGPKRMKILKTHLVDGKLILDEVQIEGQKEAFFNQVKNILK